MTRFRLFITLIILLIGTTSLSGQVLQDDNLKASYLVNFIDFVEWKGKDDSEITTIGVMGSRTIAGKLSSVAKSRQASKVGHLFKVREVNANDDWSGIDLLFVERGHRHLWPTLFKVAEEKSILLVGEEDGFMQQVGVIEFTTVKNRLRFSVNHTRAGDLSILVSSKLLKLATEIQ